MIAAVVVTYSAPPELVDRCLRSILADPVDQVILVDTGGAAALSADLVDLVDVIQTENRGYGAAVNFGVRRVPDADVIAVFNDDVELRPGWLAPLTEALRGDAVGAAQCTLLDHTGTQLSSLGVQLDAHGAGTDIGDGEPYVAPITDRPITMFTGGAVAVRREMWDQTGGFDERYFLYYEDVDLARRAAALGWQFRVVGESIGHHRRSTSTARMGDRAHYLRERNRLWAAVRFAGSRMIVSALWLSVRRLRHQPRRVHARALLAGVAGAPARVCERVRALGTRTARR